MEAAKKPLDEIMSFFTGNPFSTPVGQKIEQATDPSLASENWALNIEICDMINGSEEGAKDAVRAIRKRLGQNAGKNYSVVMYTLIVLETCVKNCGKKFHALVCHKDFLQDLLKLIGPKNDPPVVVQEKILGLIQNWADAFENESELSGVVQMYEDLKAKGIEFPMTDLDSMAPIITPKRSVDSEPILHQVDLGERQIKVTADQVAKIRRDLDLVQGNMAVFSEMLSEMKPGSENSEDLELMQELYTTCREMQKRIGELLCTISSDELTGEMLHINDELNNLFLRYGRYRKNVEKIGGPKVEGDLEEPSLIDFGSEQEKDVEKLRAKIGKIEVKEKEDFDMFAHSRNLTYEKSKTGGSSYSDNSNVDQGSSLGAAARKKEPEDHHILETHRESDFDEMESWLKANPGAVAGGGVGGETSLTSSEFDKFLQERASAATSSSCRDKPKTDDKMFGL